MYVIVVGFATVLTLDLIQTIYCIILSFNIPVTDELLVIRLIDPLGYVVSVDCGL